ncbi:MAG TPA: hypothetical protein VG012_05455 [Acidimicrobiia bacterium]|nr:hypothetical protein [Acidimicrobiia bacterium]
MGLLDGILSGLGWIWDQTGGRAAGAVWDQIVTGLVGWVVDSLAWFVTAVLTFFQRSSTPNLASGWFAGGPVGAGARSPYNVVAGLAVSLLLLCVLLSVVHGLLIGEGPAMLARLARDVPLAVFGIVATIGVVQVLLGAADEVSLHILRGTDAGAHATDVLRTLGERQAMTAQPTFAVFLLGLVAVLGAFLLWIELLVRASLLYVLLALSPLAYAAFVWPTARRILHRLAELVVALVLSKVVIAIALAVAASALAAGASGASLVPSREARLGTLLVGTIMFLLAVFAPFLILRLFPAVEAAVVARGISRAPVRATETALLTTLTVTRLAGAGSRSIGAGSAARATGDSSPSAGDGRPRPATPPAEPTVRRRVEPPAPEPGSIGARPDRSPAVAPAGARRRSAPPAPDGGDR